MVVFLHCVHGYISGFLSFSQRLFDFPSLESHSGIGDEREKRERRNEGIERWLGSLWMGWWRRTEVRGYA